MTSFYNEMVSLWQELAQCYNDVWENKSDYGRFQKREENDRVYIFLAGVSRTLDEVKGRILGRKPLPSIREVFSEIRQEETRRKVMCKDNPLFDSKDDSSALVSSGTDAEGGKKKRPWCDHCKKFCHTQDKCWKLHDKPVGWKPCSERALHSGKDTSTASLKNSA